ncbi:unnamed protein product [Phyllotreta striolata]|uniref:Uncharacterized protein n=1 Tax=Phyllotreta striolata TaxID=444603 RepID=A0A9N9XLK4_PHYSR|nr:unnamed protein product [Phyllotreta striolata]
MVSEKSKFTSTNAISEDDDDTHLMNSMEEKIENSKINILENITISSLKDPKEQLQKFYPDLKLESIKTDIKSKDSHDIYLLRVPKNVDPQALIEADINMQDGGKINIGEKYLVKPTSKVPPPMMVLSNSKNVFHFKGNIVMEKYVKPQKEPIIPIKEKSSIALPNNLKNRHPLFGNDFEDKIHLPQQVEDKLNTAIKKFLKQEKKAQEKRTKVEEVEREPVFNLLNSNSSKSDKKKPTKSELIEETLRLMKQEINSDGSVKKKKKKNKEASSPVVVKEEFPSDQEWAKKSKKTSVMNSTLLPSVDDTPRFISEISKISDDFLETTPKASKKKSKTKGKMQL